jgi:transcription initiation factor TFIIIB Brf1 subunit/transcription initiation factor TFIIB
MLAGTTAFISNQNIVNNIANNNEIIIEDILNQAENILISLNKNFQKQQGLKKYTCGCASGPEVIDCKGDILCCNCGLVLEQKNISFENESQTYGNGEDGGGNSGSSRCSGAVDPLMGKSNYSTSIKGEGRMQSLHFWQTFDYSETVMMEVKKIFTEASLLLKAPTRVIRQSCFYYKLAFNIKINDKKLIVRGKNKAGVLAGCFYFALKNANASIPLHLITDHFKINKSVFNKNCKLLEEHLKSEFIEEENCDSEYLHRICNVIGIPFKVQNICKTVFDACNEIRLFSEIQNIALICACIYFVAKETGSIIDIVKIASASKISKETIIKNSKHLTDHKIEIFNYIKTQKQ